MRDAKRCPASRPFAVRLQLALARSRRVIDPAGSKWIYVLVHYLAAVPRNRAQLRDLAYFARPMGGQRHSSNQSSQVDKKTLQYNHDAWPLRWARAKIPQLGAE